MGKIKWLNENLKSIKQRLIFFIGLLVISQCTFLNISANRGAALAITRNAEKSISDVAGIAESLKGMTKVMTDEVDKFKINEE